MNDAGLGRRGIRSRPPRRTFDGNAATLNEKNGGVGLATDGGFVSFDEHGLEERVREK